MQKHKLNQKQKEAYWNLFVNRTDVYMRQNSKGIPSKVNDELKTDVLFNPNQNIGSYQINNNNNKVKLASLDFDLSKDVYNHPDFNFEDWRPMLLQQVQCAKSLLSSRGIDSLSEFSGFKGYHLWIFFNQPTDASVAKKFMHEVFDDMEKIHNDISWEIFPKQYHVDNEGFGNYIKPPLQIHKKSGQWSYFIDEHGDEIDVDLTNVPKVDPFKLGVNLPVIAQHSNEKPDYSIPPPNMDNMFHRCEYLQQIIEDAKDNKLTGSDGHEKRLFLASLLKPFGDDGYKKLKLILDQPSDPDYDETITMKHYDSLDKKPATCNKHCKLFPCDNINTVAGRSPIKFAFEPKNDRLGSAFSERNACYYKTEKTRNGSIEKQLSTFVIHPKELLVLEDSDCLACDVESSMGYKYNNVLLENVDWHNRSKFLKAIGHQDCTFLGSDNDLQALCSYVNSKTPLRKTGTKVIGLIDDTWVVDGMNITKNGQDTNLKIVPYDKGSDAFYRKIQYQQMSDDEKETFLKSFYQDIEKINNKEIIYPIISWFFSSPLKTEIMNKMDGFPILFIHGGQGSGKSTTGRLFMRIAGYQDAIPNSCTMRPFPMLKLLSANNGIPVILDEFKVSDMRNDQIDSLLRYMRKSYCSEVEQKGRADQTVEEYKLLAPLMVMGEWNISQPALKERFLLVRFSDVIKKSKEMQQAYERVKNLPLEGFMPLYIEFCLKQNLEQLISDATSFVESHFSNVDVAPRIRNNLSTMIVGLELYQLYAHSNNINVDKPDYETLLNSQLENITGSRSGYVKSAVDQLIEELGIMASNSQLSKDCEYKFINVDKKEMLAIPFNKIFPKFKEYAQRTKYEGEILDRDSFVSLFKECEYIPITSEVRKFRDGKAARCIIIDIEKAEKAGISMEGYKE